MSSNMTEAERQLMALRALTQTTGIVHELQLLQIKYYGAVAFGHTTWEAGVDVPTKTVVYTLGKVANKNSKTLARYIAIVDNSVHWLFGPEWALQVKEGNKLLYSGQRKRKNVNRERKSRTGHREG